MTNKRPTRAGECQTRIVYESFIAPFDLPSTVKSETTSVVFMCRAVVCARVCMCDCCRRRCATIIYSPSYLQPLVNVPGDQLALEAQWRGCASSLLKLPEKCYKQTGPQEHGGGPPQGPGAPFQRQKQTLAERPQYRLNDVSLWARSRLTLRTDNDREEQQHSPTHQRRVTLSVCVCVRLVCVCVCLQLCVFLISRYQQNKTNTT